MSKSEKVATKLLAKLIQLKNLMSRMLVMMKRENKGIKIKIGLSPSYFIVNWFNAHIILLNDLV